MRSNYEWDEIDMAAAAEASAISHHRALTPNRMRTRGDNRRHKMLRGVEGARSRTKHLQANIAVKEQLGLPVTKNVRLSAVMVT